MARGRAYALPVTVSGDSPYRETRRAKVLEIKGDVNHRQNASMLKKIYVSLNDGTTLVFVNTLQAKSWFRVGEEVTMSFRADGQLMSIEEVPSDFETRFRTPAD